MNLEKEMRAYALRNAIEHGKAQVGKVLPKLFQHGLQRSEIKKIMPQLSEIIREVNGFSKEERETRFERYREYVKERKEKPHELPELKNAKNVVMRFEPSPSGPLHIGHAYVLALNSEYVKRYDGKLILRIGDTNPENIYEPAYKLIEGDAIWLTQNNLDKVYVQSERLKIYYKYFEKLLDIDKVYICECDPEKFKKLLNSGKACPCRGLGKEEQKKRWKKMFKGYKAGGAVARLKTNLNDKNPAMRDFPLMRINDSSHPRTKKKYRVWPLMNLAVSVDDIEMNVSHVIRAKDHVDNAKRQGIIYSYLGKKTPEAMFVGKINFSGLKLSSTETRKAIGKKKYSGWDDIRLPFLPALKRRGFRPEAFVKYALEVGISLTDKTVKKEEFFKAIESFNREVIDKEANRYFFVANPKKIRIKDAPDRDIAINLYPNDFERGNRKFSTSDEFYVSSSDKVGKGKNYRLMHLFNFKDGKFVSEGLDENLKAKMIHWLPVSKDLVKVKVLMPDGKEVKGFGEPGLENVKVGEMVQFERFGFVRLDEKKKGEGSFWFAHK